MSRETDGLIDWFLSLGIDGVPTEINKPGAHGKTSNHYAKGTKSAPRAYAKCKDWSVGDVSTGVDFGFMVGQRDSPGLLRIHQAGLTIAGQLDELIYAGPGAAVWISRGKVKPRSTMLDAIADAHHDHVHMSVKRGVFLKPVPKSTAAAPLVPSSPAVSEEDNEMNRPVAWIDWPTGGRTLVFPDGDVRAHGLPGRPLPHFGGVGSLKPENRQSFEFAIDITPVDLSNPEAGYVVWAQNDDQYKLDRPAAEAIKAGQL